ncbi:Disintegrin and metalloproteinase domain-containing protein 33 [Desmophyllum pertusum]|uniref:Disintegrin and metalloproteinase domain-containing protein 33 n=1 Tax=Desmophyllum pertusum TaxID=174260 RepID=A0A9W9YZY7_9CNID|nr:Disintegrin and metalloproteinase domain-containing protein 33 [Desmophyllum pertusum]
MVVISFPFNVFLKLQLLLQFTNCFEEKNRSWTWKSGDILASKTNQVLNLQYVSPRLKYISGESKPWEPRILDDQAETAENAEITFTAFQQNFTLDLYQNRGLFASRYLERRGHFNDFVANGRNINHCFYHGTVRGRERSTVSLSTCEGIEGLINDGLTSYYIEPTDHSYHLFYRLKDLNFNEYYSAEQGMLHDRGIQAMDSPRQIFNKSIADLKTRRRTRRDVFTETKYVELVIINDHKQFEACGKNLTKTNLRAKQIANIVDAIFKPLNVRVALVAMETWDVADKVKADDDAETYLSNLIKYRKRNLLRRHPNDATKLLTGVSLKDSVRGKAQIMTICTRQSAGVIQDYSRNAAFTANTFAHELGHLFGMYHDEDLPRCVCNTRNSRGCVMSEHVGREPATEFSNCSLKGLEETLSRGLGSCLFNVPRTLFGGPVCGDGCWKRRGVRLWYRARMRR